MAFTTIVGAARALRDGTLTSAGLAEQVLERTSMVEAQLHAYLTLDSDGLMEAAARADEELAAGKDRGPLHGIPIAVKDNMTTRHMETTAGSRILSGYVPPYDATAVRRLRDAGALIAGKTNLDEFAMGSSTENSAFGPTRNPWNTDRVPGGSSGGSAAAVAAGMALGGLGSDTGGSIRQPASLCGVVGAKPTYGAVSRYGLIAFASSLDQIGPLARNVRDAALALGAIAGPDPRDSTCSEEPAGDFLQPIENGIEGLRVGTIREVRTSALAGDAARGFEQALEALARCGAELVEVSVPLIETAVATYYVLANSEASANLARFDGSRYGHRAAGARSLTEMYTGSRSEGFGPEVKRRIILGTFALSSGYYDAYYGRAARIAGALRQQFTEAFEQAELLVTPTSPGGAFRLGERVDDPLAMYLSDVFTTPTSLAGIPGISVPCGLDSRGLPLGLQILARPFADGTALRAARAFERETGFECRPEPVP